MRKCFNGQLSRDSSMIKSALFLVYGFYAWFVWPAVKWILRHLTGKCELLRLTANHSKGASRTTVVEQSIMNSKCPEVRKAVNWTDSFDYETVTRDLITAKRIDTVEFPNFAADFTYCLRQIHAYTRLVSQVELLKATPFDSQRKDHQDLLDKLWISLSPIENPSSSDAKNWSLLGFQTDDNPGTDFRGMGILSLENLVYFGGQHTKLCKSLLSASNHPQHWYPFAVVGINMTEMLYVQLKTGLLKNQFHNTSDCCTLVDFHKLFCFVFYSFHEYWTMCDRDIMQFRIHREHFRRNLENRLRDIDCRLGLTGSDGDFGYFEL
ncbi:hypothetical protein P879_01530 [Paragonimus westermani]|uniref:ELMO domain-containing protein n=1 Tax=Paragonimus westermani TaxID=34504 RepID=A0A8T0DKZ6_9TREM|nr:hypothetical protein P879_01530 [Paragonimus westermani]